MRGEQPEDSPQERPLEPSHRYRPGPERSSSPRIRRSVLALTRHWFDQQTGVLLGADIEFNAGSFDFVICPESGCEGGSRERERDLDNTLVHELGHVLGLSHSDDSEATMSCQEERDGETGKRDLTPDDEAGLCALFPPSGYAQRQAEGAQADAELQRICEPVAPQSCAVKPWHLGSPSRAPGGWLGALLALSAVGLLGRRRRRDCRGTRAAWARLG